MANIREEEIAHIVSMVDDARSHGNDQFLTNLLVQVATLTLLIDAGIITVDAAIEQIEKTKRTFPQPFDRIRVTLGINRAISLLRGEVPPYELK